MVGLYSVDAATDLVGNFRELIRRCFFFVFSPVDCIHQTSAAQLSLLEDEMRRVERVNVRRALLVAILLFIEKKHKFLDYMFVAKVLHLSYWSCH